MMRNVEMQERYSIPAEIAENLKEFTEHDDDLSCEEFLMQQESVYESIKANGRNRGNTTITTTTTTSGGLHYGNESGDWSQLEGESSSSAAISQLGSDEALARALQQLEDAHFDHNLSLSDHTGSTEISPTETPARANREDDDVDPDSMSYEELQSLGDTIGTENNGLSDERISRLPTFKYNNRVGLFSKKKKTEIDQCVICYTPFDNGERLTRLPCRHKYHPKCITQWLKLKKKCPICQEELS